MTALAVPTEVSEAHSIVGPTDGGIVSIFHVETPPRVLLYMCNLCSNVLKINQFS